MRTSYSTLIFGFSWECYSACLNSRSTLNFPPPPRRRSPAADGSADLRLAVISPFRDRRHATARCLAEQLTPFATQPVPNIHLYAHRVEDLSTVVHHPPRAPG